MEWRSLGKLLLLPVRMVFCVLRAAACLLVPTRLRDLRGDTVLITGGGRGIGRHLAKEFAKQGAKKIILWGRTEKCLKETAEEIKQTGTECHYFICDVGNREEVYQQAKAVREKVRPKGEPAIAAAWGPVLDVSGMGALGLPVPSG